MATIRAPTRGTPTAETRSGSSMWARTSAFRLRPSVPRNELASSEGFEKKEKSEAVVIIATPHHSAHLVMLRPPQLPGCGP